MLAVEQDIRIQNCAFVHKQFSISTSVFLSRCWPPTIVMTSKMGSLAGNFPTRQHFVNLNIRISTLYPQSFGQQKRTTRYTPEIQGSVLFLINALFLYRHCVRMKWALRDMISYKTSSKDTMIPDIYVYMMSDNNS